MKKVLIILFFITSNLLYGQWTQTNAPSGVTVTAIKSLGNKIFAATFENGIYSSTDNGQTWIESNNGLYTFHFSSLEILDNHIFAAGSNGVYVSTNFGEEWVLRIIGFKNNYISSLSVSNNQIYAGSYSGVYYSSDYGESWNFFSNSTTFVHSLKVSGNKIFVATTSGGQLPGQVFYSSDHGQSWVPRHYGIQLGWSGFVFTFLFNGDKIYATTMGWVGLVYFSNNDGANWQYIGNGFDFFYAAFSLESYNDFIFVGTSSGVYLKYQENDWIKKNQGFYSDSIGVTSLHINNNFIYAGTNGLSIWKRELNNIVNINQSPSILPSSFSLSQNFPNPFNPTTNIRFQIPESGFVTLKVFDITGREVATLVNEQMNAGEYNYQFSPGMSGQATDGYQLGSGVYFYRLTVNDKNGKMNFSQTKKMVVVR